jgi:hypothetical protein
MRTFLRGKVTLLFMMLGLLLAAPAVAFAADTIVADGDTFSSGDQASRTFAGFFGPGATVEVGAPLAKPGIDFYVDCNGQNHFNSSQNEQASITFNAAGSSIKDANGNLVTGTGSGSLSATDLTNVTGPAGWPADGTGCGTTANAKLGTSEVTIVTPDTTGTYKYAIAYTATRGLNTAPQELDTNVTNLPGGTSATDPDIVTFTLTVDADDPTIDLRTPAVDAVYNVGDNVEVDYDCADPGATDTPPTGSGIKDPGGCVGTDSHDSSVNVADGATLDTSTPGNYSFTVNAEDNVGNTASPVTHNYTVVAPCSFSGIRPPVNDVDNAIDEGMSAYKAGSKGVIPTKFQATCDGSLVDTQAEADANPMTLSLKKLGAGAGGTDLELETPATGSANTGNLFRFDDAADQYIYNINIKGLTAGTYSITISDGSGSQTEWFVIK